MTDFETNQEVISVAAKLWRENKDTLEDLDVEAAEELAAREVTVS